MYRFSEVNNTEDRERLDFLVLSNSNEQLSKLPSISGEKKWKFGMWNLESHFSST